MIIPERLFKEQQAPIKKQLIKLYNPKTLEQITRENIKLNDEKLAKKMNNPYYFFDEKLKNGFKIILEIHKTIHAISLLKIIPNFPDIGFETRFINKILKEMATIYGRLINQYRFKYHILFSASFYKIDEEDQKSDEIELFNNLNTINKMTETDINNIDVKS